MQTDSRLLSVVNIALLSTLFSLLACLLIDPIWGYYESFMALLVSGSINNVFITENYHMGMSPITHFQALLHRHFTTVPWTGILVLLSWILIQILMIYLMIARSSFLKFNLREVALLWTLLLLLIFGISFTEFSITGVSMLLTCMALLGIWHVYHSGKKPFLRWSVIFFLTVAVFTGYSWRIESGLGGTLIAVLFLLITELKPVQLLKAFWMPAFAVFLFFMRFNAVMNTHPFFRDVEPLVFYVTDSHNPPPPLVTADSTEALIRKMARASFLIDSATFNYALFRKIADEKIEYEKQMFSLRPSEIIRQIKREASPTIKRNIPLLITYSAILIGFILFCSAAGKYLLLLQVLIFNIAIWLIICFLAYSLKMEQWHFVPIMQLAMICNVLLAAKERTEIISRKRKFVLVSVCLLLVALNLQYLIQEISANRAMIDERVMTAEAIFANQNGKLIFFDTSSRETLDDYVFRPYKLRKGVYFYDMAQLPYIPEYEQALNDLCGCNAHDAGQFFGFLKNQFKEVQYYSAHYRVEVMENFLNEVKGISVSFHPEESKVLQHGVSGLLPLTRYSVSFENAQGLQ